MGFTNENEIMNLKSMKIHGSAWDPCNQKKLKGLLENQFF